MNNMGVMTQKEIESFAKTVFRKLKLNNWKMKLVNDAGLCLRKGHLILMPLWLIGKYPWVAKEYILHEIAHIFTTDKKHGKRFYRSYCKLLKKFMVGE